MNFRTMHSHIATDKMRRKFFSAYNVSKATKSLKADIDRLEGSLTRDDVEGQIEALSDIIVCCLGGLESFGCNTERILRKIVSDNTTEDRNVLPKKASCP